MVFRLFPTEADVLICAMPSTSCSFRMLREVRAGNQQRHGLRLPLRPGPAHGIVQERLEREYDLDLIVTAPSVIYKVNMIDGSEVMVDNPATLPDPQKRESIEEPMCVWRSMRRTITTVH